MEKRTWNIHIYLTEQEYRDMQEKAERAGMSMGSLVRKAVSGIEICEAPNANVPVLIREMRRVGSALEQLLVDGAYGKEDREKLKQVLEANREAEKKIVKAFGC